MPIITVPRGSTDFAQVPTDVELLNDFKNNPSYTVIDDSTAWQNSDADITPAGAIIVGDKSYTVGQFVMAKVYQSYMSNEVKIASHLNSMNTNTRLSKAADKLSSLLSADTGGITFAQLKTLVTDNNLNADTGMTVDEFVTAATGAESGDSYTESQTKDLINTVSKYSQGKLTDNVVLQEKLTVLTSNRSTATEYLSNILKGWNDFLNQLTRRV